MTCDDVHALVGKLPFITERKARYLYDTILRERRENVLELGIAYGKATCYMAAALSELGRGKVTAVDLLEPEEVFSPSADCRTMSRSCG